MKGVIVEGLLAASTRSGPWINKADVKALHQRVRHGIRLEHWHAFHALPEQVQYHYRTLLPKLALVDLQDRKVKLITEKGNKAVFTQVFLDFDELDPVGEPHRTWLDALDEALNQVRAQLDHITD